MKARRPVHLLLFTRLLQSALGDRETKLTGIRRENTASLPASMLNQRRREKREATRVKVTTRDKTGKYREWKK